MTLGNINSTSPGLKLFYRLLLALLVMVLAERAAKISRGEPGSTADPADESSETLTPTDEDLTQPNYTSPSSESEGESGMQRLREGTILTDVMGRFKVAGDRATFIVTETGQSFGGLENLNLARVTNALRNDPEAEWCITGLVTEHRGLNFLLIQKAIRKSSIQDSSKKSPLPDAVSTPLDEPEESTSSDPKAY